MTEFYTIQETYDQYRKWCSDNKSESKEIAKDKIEGDPKKQSRGWFLTCNNPTPDDWLRLQEDNYEYCAGQVELGENGTPHIQFFIYYPTPRPMPLKKYPRCFIQKLISLKGATKYTSKTETRIAGPFEKGTRPKSQGTRSDIHELGREIMDKKMTFKDVQEAAPGFAIQYANGIKAMCESFYPKRTAKPKVIWLWGPTGVGKSRYARHLHGEDNCYPKDGTKWWYKYTQQTAIIIDDFDGAWPIRDLFRLLDPYEYIGQTKFGDIYINSPFIYITADSRPEEIFSHVTQKVLSQLMRRLDEIHELDMSWKNPPGAPAGGGRETLAAGPPAEGPLTGALPIESEDEEPFMV